MNLPPGSYAFSAPHDYTTASASRYTIGVTLSDTLGETAFAQTAVAISNPAPAFAPPGLVLSSSSIDEEGTVNVERDDRQPRRDRHQHGHDRLGRRLAADHDRPPAGQLHVLDAPCVFEQPSRRRVRNYTINGSVTNENGKVGYASTSVTVSKVAPQFTAADLSLSETTANEGDTITLNGQFTDPDTLNSYTVTIDWGDGSTPTVLASCSARSSRRRRPGLYTFSATHQYLNNPPGKLTGGTYDIHVSVSDGVNTTSADTPIVVNNVPPAVQIKSPGRRIGGRSP